MEVRRVISLICIFRPIVCLCDQFFPPIFTLNNVCIPWPSFDEKGAVRSHKQLNELEDEGEKGEESTAPSLPFSFYIILLTIARIGGVTEKSNISIWFESAFVYFSSLASKKSDSKRNYTVDKSFAPKSLLFMGDGAGGTIFHFFFLTINTDH